MGAIIRFEAARLHVSLGCTDDERRVPQDVDLALEVRFARPPGACETDALKDTVCYADLIDAARELVAGREFHTIEFLARELLLRLRPMLPTDTGLRVRVTKLHPPVIGLRGGVSFELDDEAPARP